MRLCLIFSLAFTTACSPKEQLIEVRTDVPAALLMPCTEPVKPAARTEGAFAELALGWRATAHCNADRIEAVAEIVGPQ